MASGSIFIKIIVAVASLGLSAEAIAVTTNTVLAKVEDVGPVTATTIERAEADVQIRRIKNMIANNTVDGDEAYERLEALHTKLRGNR